MGLKDIARKWLEIKNVDTKKPEKATIITTQTTVFERINQDIQEWLDAELSAKDTDQPDKFPLIEIIDSIKDDAQIIAVRESRAENILSIPISFTDEDGNLDEEMTKKLNKPWFFDFLAIAVDKIGYGYEVMQFGEIINDEFDWVEKIPEQNVLPTLGQIRPSEEDQAGSSNNILYLEDKTILKWTLAIGNPKDLGLLNKSVPLVIWKKAAMGDWSQFSEIFGMPLRVGHTDLKDDARRQNMNTMLENMAANSWATMDEDDRIEFVQQNQGDPHKIYLAFIDLLDAQISKMWLGQTGTTDEKAFVGSANVHERKEATKTTADLRWLNRVIVKQLMPFLVEHGIISQIGFPVWDMDERLGAKEKADIIKIYSEAGWQVNADFVNNWSIVEIDGIKETETEPIPVQNHFARVMNESLFDKRTLKIRNIGKGVDLMEGKRKGEKTKSIQSYIFDKSIFSERKAKAWLHKNNIVFNDFKGVN